MDFPFVILTVLTLGSAIAAMSLRNLVHCALCLVLTFTGLAAFYLKLHAEFVGFAQILVYVGAVAILIVFAILLTRSSDSVQQPIVSSSWAGGIAVGLLVFAAIVISILRSSIAHRPATQAPQLTVRDIGGQLMSNYVLPLEVMGLLLTAAMIGAVIIALRESPPKPNIEPHSGSKPSGLTETERHASDPLEPIHH